MIHDREMAGHYDAVVGERNQTRGDFACLRLPQNSYRPPSKVPCQQHSTIGSDRHAALR
jgi:hypothetical protein